MKQAIVRLLKKRGGQGYSKREIAKQLDIDPGQRKELRKVIGDMVTAGELATGPRGRIVVPSGAEANEKRAEKDSRPRNRRAKEQGAKLKGVYRQHPRGFGWFYPDAISAEQNGLDPSVRLKISEEYRDTAMDGDSVLVAQIAQKAEPAWKRDRAAARKAKGKPPKPADRHADDLLGKIVEITERRDGPVIGIFAEGRKGKRPFIRPQEDHLPPVEVTETMDAARGQLVAVKVDEWKSPKSAPVGKVVEVLGWPDDAGMDIMAVIKRHNLPEEFPDDVVAEAEAIKRQLSPAELKRRKDYRDLPIVTVDPADARDHDDACFVEALDGGGWRLHVHIADVAFFVRPGSKLDIEARKRGNSTYLVDRVMPMLPKTLSNGLCSITPDDDTATKCCIIDYDARGKVKKSRFVDAVMRSHARLSYEDAQEMMDGTGGGEIGEMLRESWKLAAKLRENRFANGALDLEFPEVKIIIDDQGNPTDIVLNEHTTSHQLIEEFMLAANEQAAQKLKNKGRPAIYRIHEDPDPDRLIDFAETARSHGFQPGDLTNRDHVQKLLEASKGNAAEYAIKVGLLKSLKRAVYAVEPLGHYGLQKADYCHFTSPIRRYADLIVHRALENVLENPMADKSRTPKQAEAIDIAKHISTTERRSAEAEIETKRMKQLEYLANKLESGDPPIYDALVTDIRRMGLFVEVQSILQRGVVKREDLPRGRWNFEPNRMQMTGPKGKVIELGQTVKVQVARVDREQQHVDFRMIGDA